VPTSNPTFPPSTIQPSIEIGFGKTFYPTLLNSDDTITYKGGSVMTNIPKVYMIYYGNFSTSTGKQFISLLDYFAQNLGNTSWWGMNTAYYQINSDGSKSYCSKSLKWIKSIQLAPNVSTGTLSSNDIIAIISKAVVNNLLPADEDGLYSFIFAGTIKVTVPGGNWITRWCGYHSEFTYQTKLLKYMLVGDASSSKITTGCNAIEEGGTVNGNYGADGAASVFAHEASEIVTNFNMAWYESGTILENADKCAWQFGPAINEANNGNLYVGNRLWLIQMNWVPKYGCMMSLPEY
jgi:hypothetical protein